MVMPFNLFNAPKTLMHLMTESYTPFIGMFVVVYFNDTLVYYCTLEASKKPQHFKVLHENYLNDNPNKYRFLANKINFFGHAISYIVVKIDEHTIKDIRYWATHSFTDVLSFQFLCLSIANLLKILIQQLFL